MEFMKNTRKKYRGEYEGELKEGKPSRIGKWKADGSNWIIEGEWKDGYLHGKVIANHESGTI